MTVLFLAAIQALPVLLVGLFARNKLALNITAIAMVLFAIAMGNIAYLMADLVLIGIAYAIGVAVISQKHL